MEKLFISFCNRQYPCTLFYSRDARPYFYWCYFEDEELVKEVGDCMGFVEKEEGLKTTETYAPRYQAVVEQIQHYILQHLKSHRQPRA